jgi:hypothetical protein
VPSNARLEQTWLNHGWRCNRGFRKPGDGCARIILPTNAYLSDLAYGREWECERGFRAVAEHCVPVKVPADGYLTAAGNDWKCEWGFVKQDEECVAVAVPVNGYLVSDDQAPAGSGFSRLPQSSFRRSRKLCQPFSIQLRVIAISFRSLQWCRSCTVTRMRSVRRRTDRSGFGWRTRGE